MANGPATTHQASEPSRCSASTRSITGPIRSSSRRPPTCRRTNSPSIARSCGDLEAASIPGIVGVWCHEVGGSRLFNAVSIQQRYAGHARQVGHAAASVHTGAYLGRYVVVVDDDIDVMDLEQVLWAMCTRSDPAESIDIIPRAWSGPLDPRIHPDKKGFSSRAIVDATRPWEWRDRFPVSQLPTPQTRAKALERWGWLVGKGEKPKDLP